MNIKQLNQLLSYQVPSVSSRSFNLILILTAARLLTYIFLNEAGVLELLQEIKSDVMDVELTQTQVGVGWDSTDVLN